VHILVIPLSQHVNILSVEVGYLAASPNMARLTVTPPEPIHVGTDHRIQEFAADFAQVTDI